MLSYETVLHNIHVFISMRFVLVGGCNKSGSVFAEIPSLLLNEKSLPKQKNTAGLVTTTEYIISKTARGITFDLKDMLSYCAEVADCGELSVRETR